MLKVKVKVGNITNLSEARYCSGMGVDLLGFPIIGPNAVSPDKFKEITDWVSGPEFVLECYGTSIPADFEALVASYKANLLEVSASWLNTISTSLDLIIRLDDVPHAEAISRLAERNEMIRYVMVSDRQFIPQLAVRFPVLLSGVSKDAIASGLDLPIAGLALHGSEELQPGLKDYSRLSDILELLETDN